MAAIQNLKKSFLRILLFEMYLLCEVVKGQKLIIPSLQNSGLDSWSLNTSIVRQTCQERWFVIDFIGSRVHHKTLEMKRRSVSFLLFGLCERLQCLLGLHQASFP